MNTKVRSFFLLSLVISLAATTNAAQERSSAWDVGYRAGTALGDGEPYNDLPIAGHVFVRRHLRGPWSVSAWIESAGGDFELPAKVVGLVQDPNTSAIDSDLSVLTVGLSGERALWHSERGSRLYGLLGVAYSSVDADDVSGPLAGGGTFDITSDPGSEVLGSLGLGYQLRLGERFSLEAIARYDHHFASWEVRDRISGNTGTIDDYSAYAFLVGLTYSF